ncbi:MAG: CHAD domain-containing protein [Thermosynechococcaceae cyanobacterium]
MAVLATSASDGLFLSNGEQMKVGTFALDLIQKQFQKFVKHKASVLQDEDPEPLHQMRVGIRRLRSALFFLAPFIDLSPALNTDLAKISRCLGRVRDLDVLGLWLQTYLTCDRLNPKEQKQLRTVTERLAQTRQKQFRRMVRMLNGKRYRRAIAQFQAWLDHPQLKAGAHWPFALVLPDLLMPVLHQWFKHPGWLVQAPDVVLHDLRKLTKALRYQNEFLAPFYGTALTDDIEDFKTIQDTLGELQDIAVFRRFLTQELGSDWATDLPWLQLDLDQQQNDGWYHWQIFQHKYLSASARTQLRNRMANPTQSTQSAP